MKRRKLPIGIPDLRSIREGGYYYVDKTPFIEDLVKRNKYYFLSRPRRFGKSLLISTLKSLFEGDEMLFRDLGIHKSWDWSDTYPVVRLSFGGQYHNPEQIEEDTLAQLASIALSADVDLPQTVGSAQVRLRDLLHRFHHVTGKQVVVLVDEYDKPILDVLEYPDKAKANRDYLSGVYGIIKDSSDHVRFAFITGITMFSKATLFSSLNNLKDISLHPRYANICGYTEEDLNTVFAPEDSDLDRNEIRRWYNGYSWLGEEKVYNPYDILELFDNRKFKPYWFKTGLPKFLYPMLIENQVNPMSLEKKVANDDLISTFDVGDFSMEALLFQSGYLSIVKEVWDGVESSYVLDFPNIAVRQSFNRGLLGHVTQNGQAATYQGKALVKLLVENQFDEFGKQLEVYLSGIPHQWYDTSDVARFEAYYAGMLYLVFRAIGVDLRVEDASSQGRADLVVLHGQQVFVLELKVTDKEREQNKVLNQAMVQIKSRGYADTYKDRNEPIHLLALVFGFSKRNLLGIRAEMV